MLHSLLLARTCLCCFSVIARLHTFYPHIEYEIVKIKTTGDKNLLTPLANIGDKGLFTKELEIELEAKNIDFVVHSLKDVPSTTLPPNMIIGAILERADPRDALIVAPWRQEKSLHELPAGSVIGTSSTRRIAQLKLNYPQFIYKNIRGNMNTRWEKLSNQELGYDAMIAAVAGFQRLRWTERISEIIEADRILYAIGQGAFQSLLNFFHCTPFESHSVYYNHLQLSKEEHLQTTVFLLE